MKKLILITLIFKGALAIAQASPFKAQTPFWQTPAPQFFNAHLLSTDKNLSKICSEYKEQIAYKDGKSVLDKEEIDLLRGLSDEIYETSFSTKFKIDTNLLSSDIQKVVAQLNTLSLQQTSGPTLPYSTLPLAELQFAFTQQSPITVIENERSLTAASRNVGLAPKAIAILGTGPNLTIKVMGKDTACDLLDGTAVLSYKSNGVAKISLADQMRSDKFYRDFSTLTNSVLEKKKSAVGRAFHIGYKMKDLFIQHSLLNDRSEDYLDALVNTFFDEEMNQNSAWSLTITKEKSLIVQGAAEFQTKITVGK